ncbi:hypothetical protein FACS1894116_10980 [Betaproteobacteria bacterium]|nr:hypothetical protein FACS1894116_10980 [Betaproteobacteria bacterium]GHT99302.1 hypothetical protein FACS1894154_06160 [Betaproteobacteria bacterium]GHU25239.1 hypothetical protein FACS189488_11770 [Betaproteobacteria bacterium]GHU32033.1 hypothetical protein FACS189497_13360 [Betaproteobacteria bacterium]
MFDWDDETGEITGPSAGKILEAFKRGEVSVRPRPWGVNISSTKSRTDMAAVVGNYHILPPELADAYPQLEDDFDGAVRDPDGNIVDHVVF